MRLKSSKTLFAYWDELRGSRVAPRRFEIEPSRIADILPETFILEKAGFNGYRFRLAGTRVCSRLGSEFRGADFLGCWDKDDRRAIERDLAVVANHGAVLVADVEAVYERGERAQFEFLILPLFHSGETIDRFMGVVSTSSTAPGAVSSSLKALKIVNSHLQWPARDDVDVSNEQDTGPGIFEPHVRTARVVRHERRTFRVYEGGLSDFFKHEK